jgi:hypothetical protein
MAKPEIIRRLTDRPSLRIATSGPEAFKLWIAVLAALVAETRKERAT